MCTDNLEHRTPHTNNLINHRSIQSSEAELSCDQTCSHKHDNTQILGMRRWLQSASVGGSEVWVLQEGNYGEGGKKLLWEYTFCCLGNSHPVYVKIIRDIFHLIWCFVLVGQNTSLIDYILFISQSTKLNRSSIVGFPHTHTKIFGVKYWSCLIFKSVGPD